MYTNGFLGMDFMEANVVVLHFLNSEALAEEYVFESDLDATKFYMTCLAFFEEIEDFPPLIQERQFRKFLTRKFGHLNYRINIY